MRYGVFGTGTVGLTISNRLAELGHEVMIGTRESLKSGDRLKSKNEAVKVGTFADAAAFGEVLSNATNGAGSVEALKRAGEANLNSKVLLDISNPLDFSKGMPPMLFAMNTDSLGEEIQRTFPNLKVVKSLNTVTAAIMVNPVDVADGDQHVFVSGNDSGAKETVTGILKGFGWIHILELGDITTARGPEMYRPIWLRMWGALGTGMSNIKIMK
ncbi:MAG TPA: NAD(P)-binding domain-containing protein [Anaerolineales bacterium]